MREIKFRVILENDLGISVEYYDLTNISNIYQQSVFTVKSVNLFTGLKDKNGVEIYEGDIVKSRGLLWKIEWTNGESRIGQSDDRWGEQIGFLKVRENPNDKYDYQETDGLCSDNYLEIIGNIYQNPELLTKTERN